MNQFKKRTITVAFAVLLLNLISPNAFASVPASFKFVGSGFGHGVGLSQIGAKGQALAGRTATQIVNYYFPGASVTAVTDTGTIRVNTAHQVDAVTFTVVNPGQSSIGGITLSDGAVPNSMPIHVPGPIKFSINGDQISATANGALINNSALWTLTQSDPNTYLSQNVSGTSIALKYGVIQLRAVKVTGQGSHIEVTDTMRLHDEYLYGISEVPSIWPAAALQSQVIVSRTYALSRMGVIKKDCDCNLYSSKYDQVYDGYAKELLPKYGALWHQAVDATAVDSSTGLAITFNNAPINVYFSASTGGQTQRAVDVWGTDIPYLTSVPDPWSLDPKLNPKYAKWTRVVSQDVMAKAFNLPDVKRYVIDSRTKTGSVLKLTAYSSTGQKSTLPVGTFKVAVKLPSSWFAMPPTITLNSQSKVGATN